MLTFNLIQLILKRPIVCQAMRNTEICIISKVYFLKDPHKRVVFLPIKHLTKS